MAPHTPTPTLSVREALTMQITDAASHNGHLRTIADVISSGNAGILPPNWSSEVRDSLDTQRYMFPNVGGMAFPTQGYTLTIPKLTQHALVAARGTEKSGIAGQAMTTGSDNYTAAWYAGGVDVALELVMQSDPSVVALVVESLLSSYATVTDQALTRQVEAAGAAVGAILDFTSWNTLSAQVITQAEVIRAASGQFGDRMSLTTVSWQKLIGLSDADGRRIFAPIGATNADATASILSRSIDIGGVLAFHNPRGAEDVMYNEKSARVAEKPPIQVTSDNVNLMGRDFGVLGAYIWIPAFPAGIRTFSLTKAAK